MTATTSASKNASPMGKKSFKSAAGAKTSINKRWSSTSKGSPSKQSVEEFALGHGIKFEEKASRKVGRAAPPTTAPFLSIHLPAACVCSQVMAKEIANYLVDHMEDYEFNSDGTIGESYSITFDEPASD